MKIIQGIMTLVLSKKVKDKSDGIAKFDELNIAKVEVKVTLMDGSVHMIEVDDHFVEW